MQILTARRTVKSCTPSSTTFFMEKLMRLTKFVAVVFCHRLFIYFRIYYQFYILTSKCLGPGCCLLLKFRREFWLDYACSIFGISCTYRPLYNKHENVIFANNSFIEVGYKKFLLKNGNGFAITIELLLTFLPPLNSLVIVN